MPILLTLPLILFLFYVVIIFLRIRLNRDLKYAITSLNNESPDSWTQSIRHLQEYLNKIKKCPRPCNRHYSYILELFIFKLNDYYNICSDPIFKRDYSYKLKRFYHFKIFKIFFNTPELYSLLELYKLVITQIYSQTLQTDKKKLFKGEKDNELLAELKEIKLFLLSKKVDPERKDLLKCRMQLDNWLEDDIKFSKLSTNMIWNVQILIRLIYFDNIKLIRKICSRKRINDVGNKSFFEFYSLSFVYFIQDIVDRVYEIIITSIILLCEFRLFFILKILLLKILSEELPRSEVLLRSIDDIITGRCEYMYKRDIFTIKVE